MSRIEELIKQKCPNGVEYFPLLTVANVLYGYPCDASLFNTKSDGKPLARIRDVLSGVSDTYTTENVPERYELAKGDLLVGMDGKFHVANWKTDGGILCQRVCKVYSVDVENTVTNGYLSHILGPIIKKIEEGKPSGTVKHLLDKDIKAIEIPVPPMEVQQEIVYILDSFVELELELQAELKARKKQYEYYREKLLNFGNDVEYRSLGDSCYIKARIGWQKLNKSEYLSEGDYYLVTGVNITKANRVDFGSCYFVSKERYDMDVNIQLQNGDIIITKDGTIGKVALIEEMDKPAVLNSHLFVIRDITGKLNHKFLLYIFLSNYFARFVEGNKTSGTIAGLNQATMVKFSIPFPSLDEQEHIVGILDKFVQLIESMTKEIEARHKQYEYYRDKLLTFERKVV